MARTRDDIIDEITAEYLADLDLDNLPSTEDIKGDIVNRVADALSTENAVREKENRMLIPKELLPNQIAQIIQKLYNVCAVVYTNQKSSTEYDQIAVYQEDGLNKGIYVADRIEISKLVRKYNKCASKKCVDEVIDMLSDKVEHKLRCSDPDLIPVNNGIFNYKTKTLMPFDPNYIFTAKSKVNYIPNPVSPVIHNNEDGTDWDIDTWMDELSDDPEIVNLLWEILGAIIRPNVKWNKAAFFYSTTGNNGKGTLCELMRNLCGDGNHTSISLESFSNDVMLEQLPQVSAIITDENDVGTYMEKAANFKAIITQDVIKINRKYKSAIQFQFKGFVVLCVNEMPRIRDKSDSFYRRQLFVPFEKCFTGIERTYIKSDYLKRKDVLEYVLHKVLNTDYYKLSEPDACRDALDDYKVFNDPIRQFLDEILPECKWDLLPWAFLYDLYKEWLKKNVPNGKAQSIKSFQQDIPAIINKLPEWKVSGNNTYRASSKITEPEPLILEYNLTNWMNKTYTGNDTDKICTPSNLREKYKGLIRV